MRIGVYIGGWNLTDAGGMGIYLANLLQAAARQLARPGAPGHRLALLVDQTPDVAERCAALGADLPVVPLRRPPLSQLAPAERRRAIALRAQSYRDPKAADRRRADRWSRAAHAYLWGLDEAVEQAGIDLLYFPIPPYVKRPRAPYLLTVHDLKHIHRPQDHDRNDLARRRRWSRVARAARLVVSSYSHIREDVVTHLRVAREQTAVLPIAVPDEIRDWVRTRAQPHGTPRWFPRTPFALLAAQFWPHKNHAGVIRALGILRRETGLDIPLVCTGHVRGMPGADAALVRHVAVTERVSDLVRFIGHVDRAELRQLYESCRFAVAPTLYDPGSFPVLEALALGKPVAASRVTSIPEAVGDAGLLFDPAEPREIAGAMQRLWLDQPLRQKLAKRGPARIGTRTWDDVAAEWLTLCDECMAPPRPAATDRAAAGDESAVSRGAL